MAHRAASGDAPAAILAPRSGRSTGATCKRPGPPRAPPFGTDADRLRQSAALLRQHLTDTEFRGRVETGEQMDGSQVIHFAQEAIARAATRP